MIPDNWGDGAKEPPFIHCWMSGGPRDGEVRGTRPSVNHIIVREHRSGNVTRTGCYDRVGDILLWMGWFKT